MCNNSKRYEQWEMKRVEVLVLLILDHEIRGQENFQSGISEVTWSSSIMTFFAK